MGQIILNVLGVILLLAFMSASLAIRSKLLARYQELTKRAEEEGKPSSSLINKLIWDTLRMK